MKNIYMVLLIIPIIFFESCNSDFNVNAPYKEDVYILNCILHNDSNIQYAVISKSTYSNDGTTPNANPIGQNVKGADIRIFYNDSVFVMRDTTIMVNETHVNCYYLNNLEIKPDMDVSITASIPGGKILKASAKTPKLVFSPFMDSFPQRNMPQEIKIFDRYGYRQTQYYDWSWVTNNGKVKDFMCLPQLEIIYKKFEAGMSIKKNIFVPLGHEFDEYNHLIPINQKYSLIKNCIGTLAETNKTMLAISGNDSHRSNYSIEKVILHVRGLDEALSKYCSANNEFDDNFSVKTKITDVTNIEGGKGIFGTCIHFSKTLTIEKFYVQSFGYSY